MPLQPEHPTLFFGTHNRNKAAEVQAMVASHFRLCMAADMPGVAEPEETGKTLEENALLKARAYHRATGLPTLADDTGLEVAALGGAPGVHSARYAGPQAGAEANMQRLLQALAGQAHRQARFRTVFVYIDSAGQAHQWEGILEGHILAAARGSQGFGYDPIFCPLGSTRSLAEHSPEEKNAISHRGIALRAFVHWLQGQGT